MPDPAFMSALGAVTSGSITLSELIDVTARLAASGSGDLADQLYRIWIRFNPDHPQRFAIHFNLASRLTSAALEAEAEVNLRAALELKPDFMPAYINLGGVLERTGRIGEAVNLWLEGSGRMPEVTGEAVFHKTTLLKQAARVLMANQQTELAEQALNQCLEIDPSQVDAIGQYVPLRQSCCKWPVIAPVGRLTELEMKRYVQPLSLANQVDDPLLMLSAAYAFVKRDVSEKGFDPASDRRSASTDLTGRRLRLGYVSSDLRDHAIGYLMAELFELHDREKVEVFAYFCGSQDESPLSARIKTAVEHWVDIRKLDDAAAAAQIAADQIDVLVDVNGLTKDARTGVFARRPAPIQVNWLGFPGSMGSPYHQYIIADEWIIPPELERYYSETVIRLPCYQPNDRKRVVSETPASRAEAGLPEDAFVFCCFNGSQKITQPTFDRWMKILLEADGSVLWLLASAPETEERLKGYAAARGVDPSRIVFAPKLKNDAHLARYVLADLFLDTFPYGAHTTASDALWMGVPVLTFSGLGFPSRVCGSLVSAVGLKDLVCSTSEEYIEKAIAYSQDALRLANAKYILTSGKSSCRLFDVEKIVCSLETSLRHLCVNNMSSVQAPPNLTNLDIYHEILVEADFDGRHSSSQEAYVQSVLHRIGDFNRGRPLPFDGRIVTVGGNEAGSNSQR